MSWSRGQHRMSLQLQAIERARKGAAEARLLGARSALTEAGEARAGAGAALAAAEAEWRDHLASPAFNLELGQALGRQILVREAVKCEREAEERAAEEKLEREQRDWQAIEAMVRLRELALRRGRRALDKRAEEARASELAEANAWKWFRK
jgi:hypothetical protein